MGLFVVNAGVKEVVDLLHLCTDAIHLDHFVVLAPKIPKLVIDTVVDSHPSHPTVRKLFM